MNKISIDLSNLKNFISEEQILRLQAEIDVHYPTLFNKTGKGNDFLGWVDLPSQIDQDLFKKIEDDVTRLQKISEIFVVIGIGGSKNETSFCKNLIFGLKYFN